MMNSCVTAERSGRHPPVHSRGVTVAVRIWCFYRPTIHHKEEKQQLPKKGSLPSGQAAMPKLITTVNVTVSLTSLETLRLTTSKQKNKEKLRDD